MGRIVVATDGSEGAGAAVAEGIDLARRLAAVAGSLLGSVSSGVVRHSHRPVVVVREPGERARDEAAEYEADRSPREVGPAPA